MQPNKKKEFLEGLRDGIPIALGYFAVSFSLGIAAKRAGLTAIQAALACFTTNASAGAAAAFTVIKENGSYLTMALMILVANARYLLMSTALSQRVRPELGIGHRLLMSYDITDEIFGVCVSRPLYLTPYYAYGTFVLPLLGWAMGAYFGVVVGNILPTAVVSALSVSLYGMFLAIIIPPAKKMRILGVLIVASMVLSYLCSILPGLSNLSSGNRIILLTVLIAGAAAFAFPVKEASADESGEEMA